MPRPYSQDLRDRVIEAALSGKSVRGSAAQYGIGVAIAILWVRRVRESGERSARKTAHASEQARPDVAERREDWFEGQLELDPERLVFIDETLTKLG